MSERQLKKFYQDLLNGFRTKSPNLKRETSQSWYDEVAIRCPPNGMMATVMNYGFHGQHYDSNPLKLIPSEKRIVYCLQLYHEVATSGTGKSESSFIKGRNVLEVGCGRGGGASYISKNLQPISMTGIDSSNNNISIARETYGGIPNLRFSPADAESLPFPEASFDTVINIESSHSYGNMQVFCNEVFRVLRPGGYLLFADLRSAKDCSELQSYFKNSGFIVLQQVDITDNVCQAMTKASNAVLKWIKTAFHDVEVQDIFKQFMGTTDSRWYKAFCSRKALYIRFVLQKPKQSGIMSKL